MISIYLNTAAFAYIVGKSLMKTVLRLIASLFLTGTLASCATASANGLGPQMANGSGGTTAAAIAKITEVDRQSVADGLDPPETLKYDAELAAIMPEGEEILAKHDKARAKPWMAKYNAIMSARTAAIQRFSAKQIAAANAITNTFGGIGRPTSAPASAPAQSSDPNLPDGFSDWCQNPADATQLVPCNH